MDEQIKISEEYKKGFNRGYNIAKEMDLRSSMFQLDTTVPESLKPYHHGIQQYISEISNVKKLGQKPSNSSLNNKLKKPNKGISM
ncbi:hypothetical protein NYZ99_15555 [Maribacter litopenaei]|uniref:Transposase n=1 Tax=Maribacter litopenaei TaxID=2976127 RepID=A0ABY5Y5P2_9FLAO|nr:hypothetical protein [Maribacter litopenaei]UWX54352.1 hypothetical protein NYZ99_15555 [Maribacter litopenaei]